MQKKEKDKKGERRDEKGERKKWIKDKFAKSR